MNDKAIYLDTNFIIGKQSESSAEIVNELRKQGFEVFVTRTVVEEVKAKNRRELIKIIDDLKGIVNHKLCKIYFPLDEATLFIETEKILDLSDEKCDSFFKSVFKDHIIEDLEMDNLLQALIERDKKKTPPFADGASDKGWKDTIIWMAIIRHAKKAIMRNSTS